MPYELIITEKPNASKRIAEALADGKPVKKAFKGVPYYELSHGRKDIVVGCAVGHLYGLAEKVKTKNFHYPVFDIEWKPNFEISKDAAFSEKYLEALKKLAKQAGELTVATDYDVEGEVIGLNVVRFACGKKDARRMKFSTLTKPDLEIAYEKASSRLDWGQAIAGETRHYLDYYYGINLSRALTKAISSNGMFKILSTGRVQGPALKIIVDKEKEIKAFKPVPYWQIELQSEKDKQSIIAWHEKDQFWDKKEAEGVYAKIKAEKKAQVAAIEKNEFEAPPPVPFDLTTLQTEAYRCFGINPKVTLDIAQNIYTNGLISYPRTSSQQLPPAIGHKRILEQLSTNKAFTELCQKLLKKPKLWPRNGKKTDPAHPAIFPTGLQPKALDQRHAKIYDLIVKRFMATFADSARRETVAIKLAVKGEIFIAKGTRTTFAGWHEFYRPYVKLDEEELPKVVQGEQLPAKKIILHEDATKPPKRYTPSSIIRDLEKRNLGTKATRAEITDTLYRRHYVIGESIEATELGIKTIDILEKYCPKILDEEMTRHFENDMDEIREGKKKKEEVLDEAKKVLLEILDEFKHKEKEIGKGLQKTFTETRAAMTTVGKCPVCQKGSLVLRKGKFGRFAACDKYPDCKTTFSLPASGGIVVGEDICKHCKYPMIKMIRKGKKPQDVCINKECPSKKVPDIGKRKCPKCKEGQLVVRKSVYGAFIACNKFPKCRHTEKIEAEA